MREGFLKNSQMKFRLPIAFALLLLTGMLSCKKNNNGPGEFQPITFKFGQDATSIEINQASQTVKNMPHSCDPTQLVASAVLPTGFTISPDATTVKDYTKGVTYTITNSQGRSYTMRITAPVYDSATNPYGIYTARHLSDIRKAMNAGYVLMNDIDLPNLNAPDAATTTGLSDYATYGWYSIGSSYVNGGHVIFRGSLDGQNHVIRNLTSSYRGSDIPAGIDPGHNGKSNDGLFGYSARATFKNLGIQLAARGINDLALDGNSYGSVGALVGLADTCTITSCYVTGNASIVAGQYTGGLMGKALNSTISKSYSALTPAAGTYAVTSGADGGGLIGWLYNSDISDSYSSSSVIGSVGVGGLIGMMNTTTLKTCYASGNVAETPSNTVVGLTAPNSLGGLIGSVTSVAPSLSTIQNSYATGAVTGANGSNATLHQATRIGGLIGQINSNSGPVLVTFSYATGAVTRVHTSATVPYLTGGLAGTTNNNVFISSAQCTNYWDKEKTGQTTLGGGNGALAQDNDFTTNGKTTAQMKVTSTFLNWDFSSVWAVAAGANNGYPSLRSFNK
jgi:hypothetical protein